MHHRDAICTCLARCLVKVDVDFSFRDLAVVFPERKAQNIGGVPMMEIGTVQGYHPPVVNEDDGAVGRDNALPFEDGTHHTPDRQGLDRSGRVSITHLTTHHREETFRVRRSGRIVSVSESAMPDSMTSGPRRVK